MRMNSYLTSGSSISSGSGTSSRSFSRVGAVGDDQKLAVDRSGRGRADKPGSSAAWRRRVPAHFMLFHRSFLADHFCRSAHANLLLAAVHADVEGANALQLVAAAPALPDGAACGRRRGSRPASAPPWCAARIHSPWTCPRISWRDRSAERCCRPCRRPRCQQLPPRAPAQLGRQLLEQIRDGAAQLLHLA